MAAAARPPIRPERLQVGLVDQVLGPDLLGTQTARPDPAADGLGVLTRTACSLGYGKHDSRLLLCAAPLRSGSVPSGVEKVADLRLPKC